MSKEVGDGRRLDIFLDSGYKNSTIKKVKLKVQNLSRKSYLWFFKYGVTLYIT